MYMTKAIKSKMAAIRFSPTEHSAIKKHAEKAKMNFTEYITSSALNKPIVIIDGLDEVQKEQKAIGRNLNQITTLCNMGKITVPDLGEVKSGFSTIANKLNDILNRCS